jgi:hypothetical protein
MIIYLLITWLTEYGPHHTTVLFRSQEGVGIGVHFSMTSPPLPRVEKGEKVRLLTTGFDDTILPIFTGEASIAKLAT